MEEDDPRNYNFRGESHLMRAINRGDIERALYFINQGLYIRKTDRGNRTPLMLASQKGNDVIVSALIKQNVDIHAYTHFKTPHKTALLAAIDAQHQSTVDLLVRAGARTDTKISLCMLSNKPTYSLQEYAAKKEIRLDSVVDSFENRI